MARRPAHLDLSNDQDEELQPPKYPNFHMDLPSPRAGEAPPALSPLDAFAMHSRMLAKRFDDEAEAGRRISRLPHNTVAKELANRPSYFRHRDGGDGNMSDISESQDDSRPSTQGGHTATKQEMKNRHKSQYPMLGRVSRQDDDDETPYYSSQNTPNSQQDYFTLPRSASPEAADPRVNVEAPSPAVPSLTNSLESVSSSQQAPRSQEPMRSIPDRSLAPHLSPPSRPKSSRSLQSIRAVRQDSGDDDLISTAPLTASTRKFSGSSGMSQPHSPFTPSFMNHPQRSPSMTSEYSINAFAPSPRPIMNFSRPDRPMSPEGRASADTRRSFESRLSFDSRPSADAINRHPSVTSSATTHFSTSPPPQSRQGFRDDVPKPFASEGYGSDSEGGSKTYTYSKFTLPRGRGLDRTSTGLRTSWIEKQFQWDKEAAQNAAGHPGMHARQISDAPTLSTFVRPASPAASVQMTAAEFRRGRERAFSSANRSHSADPHSLPRTKALHTPSASIATDSTDRTIKPSPLNERELSTEVSAEDHLEIGIQAHNAGQTNKSTYHLRLAAKAGLPTAMLFYALACRHGWGMRANQEEGVKWLRKAIDESKLEEQDVDQTLSNATRRSGILDPNVEAAERKKRKAQFALAIYELGQSYMNGWGCPKDRGLALKCYEIAAKWGDCDALAEAGFCYAQGLGCKKDMKKAATLYRKAADAGMSMAGNSWIYKTKYMDETELDKSKKSVDGRPATSAGKDPAKRARSRSIWSRPKKEK